VTYFTAQLDVKRKFQQILIQR